MTPPAAPETLRPRRRLLLRGTLLLLALLAAAHGATWWVVTGRILDGIPRFAAAAAQDGWVLAGGPPSRAGWPLAATVRVSAVTARRTAAPSATLGIDRLDLTILPSDPGRLRVTPHGDASLSLGAAAPLPLRAAEATLLVPLDGTGPAQAAARDLLLGPPGAGLRLAGLEARFDPAALVLRADGVQAVPPLPAPFDGGAHLSLRVLLQPGVPPAPTPRAAAAAWQAASGRITAPELLLDWGPLRVEGTLAATLDPALQPSGEARLRVTGALSVLEAASRAGLVQPGPASAARAVLTLLTVAAKGGPVTLPVLLRNGTLTVAQFALLRVPPFTWSD